MIIAFEGPDASFKETNAKKLYNRLQNNYKYFKRGKEEFVNDNNNPYIRFESFPRYNARTGAIIQDLLRNNFSYKTPEIVAGAFNYDYYSYWYEIDTEGTVCLSELNEYTDTNKMIYVFDRYIISNVVFQTAITLLNILKENKDFDLNEIKNIPYDKFIKLLDEDITKVHQFALKLWNDMVTSFKIPKPDIVIHMELTGDNESLEAKSDKDVNESNSDLQGIINNVYHYVYNKIAKVEVIKIDVKKYAGANELVYRTPEAIFTDIANELGSHRKFRTISNEIIGFSEV